MDFDILAFINAFFYTLKANLNHRGVGMSKTKQQLVIRPENSLDIREVYKKKSGRMKESFYEEELQKLHIELCKLQNWVKKYKKKIMIIFEGRDAAGKGGMIKALTEHLNPRGCRTVALSKPTETESTEWYFKRYISTLPSGGEIVFYDRSWYNRAGVEKVMGFCTQEQYKEFITQVANLENMIRTPYYPNVKWTNSLTMPWHIVIIIVQSIELRIKLIDRHSKTSMFCYIIGN